MVVLHDVVTVNFREDVSFPFYTDFGLQDGHELHLNNISFTKVAYFFTIILNLDISLLPIGTHVTSYDLILSSGMHTFNAHIFSLKIVFDLQ